MNISSVHVATAMTAAAGIGGTYYAVSSGQNPDGVSGTKSDAPDATETKDTDNSSHPKTKIDYSKLLKKDKNLQNKLDKNPSSQAEASESYQSPSLARGSGGQPPPHGYDSGSQEPVAHSEVGKPGEATGKSHSDNAAKDRSAASVDDKDSNSSSKDSASKGSSEAGGIAPPKDKNKEEQIVGGGSVNIEAKLYMSPQSPGDIVAGTCSTVQIQFQNSSGGLAKTTRAETVKIESTGSGKFYTDATCTTEYSLSVPVASNVNELKIYYKNTTAENISYTLTTGRRFIPEVTANLTIIAADVASIKITGDSALFTGACAGPLSVKQYDIYGNLAPASTSSYSYSVTGFGSALVYADAACSTAQTTYSLTGTSTGFDFYLKDSLAEALSLVVDDSGDLDPATFSTAMGPSKLALVMSSPIRSGDCQPITLNLKDQLGNISAAIIAGTYQLTETAARSFYGVGDSTCAATAITSVAFAVGESSKALFFKPTGMTSVAITASDSTSKMESANVTANVSPRSLFWDNVPLTSAGTCLAVKLKTQDSAGASANVLAAQTINLTSSSASSKYYAAADTNCTGTILTSITIPSGTSEVELRLKDGVAETITMTATDTLASLITANSVLVIGPNGVAILGSTDLRSGDCGLYTLGPRDTFGNPTTVLQNVDFSLSDLTAAGSFYASTDTTCTGTTISTVSLLSGSSGVDFRYKDNKAENSTFAVDDMAGELASGSKTIAVGPRDLNLAGSTQILSGNCTAYTMKFKDAQGNFANTTIAHTINLTDTTPEGSFYSDAACTTTKTSHSVAAGTGTVTFYYKNTKQQNATISTTASTSELTVASLTINVGPYKLVSTGNTETRAGECESFTVQTKDVLDNVGPVQSTTTINLSDGTAAGNFYASTDTTCTGSTISTLTIASGSSSTAFRYKNNKSEVSNLTVADAASAPNLQTSSPSLNVGPRDLAVSVPAQLISGLCNAVTVTAQDVNTTTSAVIRNTTVNLTDGTALGGYYSDSGCTAAITNVVFSIGQSTKTVYYRDDKAETITLAADDAASWLTSATANTQTGPYKIIVTGTTPVLASACTQYTITTKDFANNTTGVLGATTMTLTKGTSTTALFYSDAGCTAAITTVSFALSDSAKTFYMKDPKAETFSVGASDGASGMVDGTLSVTVGPDRVVLTENTTPHRSGDCDAYTITAKDTLGNTANTTSATTLNLTDNSATGDFYTSATCATPATTALIASGANNAVIYYKNTIREGVTLTATDAAASLLSSSLNVNIGPYKIIVTGTTPVLASSCNMYTVTTKDFADNVAGVYAATTMTLTKGTSTTALFYSDAGCTAAITTLAFAVNDSSKTFYMKDPKAELFSLGASDGASGMVDGTLAMSVGPDRFAITANTTPHRSGDCDAYTITTKDTLSNTANTISAVTINLTDNSATGDFYTSATCATPATTASIALGANSVVIYYKDDVRENVTLTATDAAASLLTANFSSDIGPAALFITGPTTPRASDCSAMTLTTKDAAGNTAAVWVSTPVSITDATATGNYFSDAACTVGITSMTFAIGDSSKTAYYKDLKAEAATLTADDGAGGLAAGTLAITVGPSKLAVTGRTGISWSQCYQYAIRSRDELNNNAAVFVDTVVDLGDGAGSGVFYADADTTCTGAPITTATIANGTALVNVRYMNSIKELVALTTSDQAAYLASGTMNVEVGAEKFNLTGPTPIRSGECSLYTIESQDSSSAAQPVLIDATINVNDGAGVGLAYAAADTTCTGTAITTVLMTIGNSQQTFRYKNNTAQNVTLNADDGGGRDPGTLAVKVGPDRLDLFGGNRVSISGCTAYSITARDTAANTANVLSNTTFSLDDGGAAGDFYDTADTTCVGAPITQKTITNGTSSVTVYYKDTVSESLTMSIADLTSYLLPDTFAVEVGADRLAFSGAASIKADQCELYTVITKNNAATDQNSLTSTVVNLTDATASGNFYDAADTTCTGSVITSVTVAAASSSIDFRYKDSKAETAVLTADDGTYGLTTGTASIVIGPKRLNITGSNSMSAGQCGLYTVNSKDGQSTNANVLAATTVNLTDGSAAGNFYDAADTTCTGSVITSVSIALGSNSATFRYADDTAQFATLRAQDASSTLSQGTLSVGIGPGKLVLTGASPIRSGDCTAYTVTGTDVNNVVANATTNMTINLAKGGSSGSFYDTSDTTCSGAAVTSVTLNSGSSSVDFYFKDNKAESSVLTVSDGTTAATADARTVVTTAKSLSIAGSATAVAGSCTTYTVSTIDAAGTASAVAADTTISLDDGSANGDFYASADSTCSGSTISSYNLLSGSSTFTVKYKNSTAEASTLTADDGVGNMDAGSKVVTMGPSQLVLTGVSPQEVSYCGLFTLTSKDPGGTDANATANITVNVSDGVGSGVFYAAGDTSCTTPVSSVTILNGSSSVGLRYKNAVTETVTLTADDAGGVLSSASLSVILEPVCMGSFKVEPLISGTPTYSMASGNTFDVKITAIDGGGATLSCYTGTRSITWTMSGTTSTAVACGQSSGAPTSPSETTLNFVSGVATTTSNTARFQIAETTTVTATSGSKTGTSNNITVSAGPLCQIRIKSATAGGGSIITTKNIDLNVSSSTSNSTATLYAAGFDSGGNYLQDVTVVWSGTGSVFPWAQTTNVSSDTAKVVGVKVGTGTLKADYMGGGGDKTATVNFTVSATNPTAAWSTGTTDLDSNSVLGNNQVLRSLFWNAAGDSSTSWLKTGSQSWRSETFASNVRGSRLEFPDQVYLVGHGSGLDVIDATNNVLWMRWSLNTNRALDSNFGSITGVAAINGRVAVALRQNSSVGTIVLIDLINDTIKRIDANGTYSFSGNISSRNTAGTWSMEDAAKKLGHSSVYSLKAKTNGSYDIFLAGTGNGATALQFSGATLSTGSTTTSAAVTAVDLDSSGHVYLAEYGSAIHRGDLSFPTGAWSVSRSYTGSTDIYLPSLNVSALRVATGTSTAETGSNTLFVGSDLGLTAINEHSTQASTTSIHYSAKGSGLTGFSGALFFNGVDGSASWNFSGSALGPAQGHDTTIEFWFAPSATLNSGTQTLYQRGSGNSSLSVSIVNGILNFTFTDSGGTPYTLQSTATSWNQGQWVHFAGQISSAGLEMWTNGADHKSLSISLAAETLSSATSYLGANDSGTQNFAGQIDELRISKLARYSGASFAVPSSAFSNDTDTVTLFHMNSVSSSSVPYADSIGQMSLTLNGTAAWTLPKMTGTENKVLAIDVKVSGTAATTEVISGPSSGGWTEILNGQNSSTSSTPRSQTLNNINDIFIYQADTASDLDVGFCSASAGLSLLRN